MVAASGVAWATVSHAQENAATAPAAAQQGPGQQTKQRKKGTKGKGAKSAPGAPATAASLPADKLEGLRLALVSADDGAAVEAAGTLGSSGSTAAAEGDAPQEPEPAVEPLHGFALLWRALLARFRRR